mmetsp:Transcript_18638/g.51098  ORF Transcript_18638/g.51098 Transcript_18638/m.51098 type:complete len:210 (+) Transcript_18638:67-696(+)
MTAWTLWTRAHTRRARGRTTGWAVALLLPVAGWALLAGVRAAFVQLGAEARAVADGVAPRRDALQRVVALGLFPALAGGTVASPPANAVVRWSGKYKDSESTTCGPISVTRTFIDSNEYEISGVSSPSGMCKKGEKGIKKWSVIGTVTPWPQGSGEEMVIDFSKRGGPGDVVAKFETDEKSKVIVFPDGRKWRRMRSQSIAAQSYPGGD